MWPAELQTVSRAYRGRIEGDPLWRWWVVHFAHVGLYDELTDNYRVTNP